MGASVGQIGIAVSSPPGDSALEAKLAAAAQQDTFRRLNSDALQRLETEQKNSFKQAKEYSQLVLGVFYAGLFALWHQTDQSLVSTDRAWVGLTLVISLISYVVADVFNVLYLTASQIALFYALKFKKADFAIAESAYQKQKAAGAVCIIGVWLLAFPLAVIAALVSAKTLVIAFVWQMIK